MQVVSLTGTFRDVSVDQQIAYNHNNGKRKMIVYKNFTEPRGLKVSGIDSLNETRNHLVDIWIYYLQP